MCFVFLSRVAVVRAQQSYVKASNSRPNLLFGTSVDVSADGSVLVVGASGDTSLATGVNGDQLHAGGTFVGAVYQFQPFSSACGSLPSCSCVGTACTSTVPVTSNATLTVATDNMLTVQGNVTLTGSATVVASVGQSATGPLVSSTGVASVNGTLQLVIGAVPSGNVTVVQAAVVTGMFSSVTVTSSSACSTATASAPQYGPTTVSVAFQTTNTCGGGGGSGLSTGAIAGIVVGGVLALAALAAVVGVAVTRRREGAERARIDKTLKEASEMTKSGK